MLKKLILIALFVTAAGLVGSFALAQVDSLAVVVGDTPKGPTILDQIASLLAALTPILTFLVGTGLVYKYLPWLKNLPNALIPVINAVLAFLAIFSGPAPANASIFGDLAHALSFPAKAAGSFLLSGAASIVYETFIRPWLEKAGIYPAGSTKPQVAVKAKAVVN